VGFEVLLSEEDDDFIDLVEVLLIGILTDDDLDVLAGSVALLFVPKDEAGTTCQSGS
jgi:hypothetical protein